MADNDSDPSLSVFRLLAMTPNGGPHCLYQANIRSKVSQNLSKKTIEDKFCLINNISSVQTICISETCTGIDISDMSQHKSYNSSGVCKLFYSYNILTGS